ncbi:MAG: type II secretion system GspH family protein [Candidatus Fibromonas sp.]|nr:type II secretion system GspH family protein [Candidatus Fibromonas sp.]
MLELMAVIVIIGILSSLAYAGLMEMIFTNRAKETAQTMRTFAERALADGKRQGKDVIIALDKDAITYSIKDKENSTVSQPLSNGFSSSNSAAPDCEEITPEFQNEAVSQFKIGISGIDQEGYFAACGAKGYCAAAVKSKSKNSFIACIRRGNPPKPWEAL